jgi:CubicO group peptidase (beta-lactamase class C family)
MFLKTAAASAAWVLPAVAVAQSPQAAARPPSGKGGLSKARLARMRETMARHGWGFGMAVVTRRDDVARSVGAYGWDGGYGTSWYAEPREDMTGILMTQRVWDSPVAPGVNRDFWTSAYQAIDD